MNPEECVLGWAVDCCFRLRLCSWARSKMLKWGIETTPTRSDSLQDWMEMTVDMQTWLRRSPRPISVKQKPQLLPLVSCVLRSETTISAKRRHLGHFCCRVIYEHQLFPFLGISAMTTMWVGPVCGTDSWHSRLLMSHRPEDGSDSEQILGFSVKLCYAVFWMLGYGSCKGSKIAAQRGMCRYLRLSGSSTGVICV